MDTLLENIISSMASVCLWEGVSELKNFRIAVSPNNDVYCSKPNGEWYDEYQPKEDWTIYEVATEKDALAIATNNY